MRTYLEEIQALIPPAGIPPDSPSLLLNKYAELDVADKKGGFSGESKKRHLARVVDAYSKSPIKSLVPEHDIPGVRSICLKLGWRLVLDLGGGLIENSGLNLHPLFGYPEIPGSAVKGLARAAAINELIETQDDDSAVDLICRIALIFGWGEDDWNAGRHKRHGEECEFRSDFEYACGSERWPNVRDKVCSRLESRLGWSTRRDRPANEQMGAYEGGVAFLAARPDKAAEVQLVVDIVNCHHGDYYRSEDSSAEALDNENPVPNYFLAAEGGHYVFGVRRTRSASDVDLAQALKWISMAIADHGAGAKSAAGYGWFEPDAAYDKAREEKEKRVRTEKAAKVAEKERLGRLSPEELEAEEYLAALGADPLGALKGKMAQIVALPETEQKAICLLLNARYSKEWQADVADAKKNKEKAVKRVSAVRLIAEKLGVKLP